jgi:hypothetical protein
VNDIDQRMKQLLNESVDAQLGPRRPAPPFVPRRIKRLRRFGPWAAPLVAVASVTAVIAGTVGVAHLASPRHHPQPGKSVTPPTPTPTTTPTPTSTRPKGTPTTQTTGSPRGSASSQPSSSSAPSSTPPPATSTATDWDIDGDGRPDRGQLVFLGGYGPNNWQLVVDMTSLGRQIVPFTGEIALPGEHDVRITGSVDADHDGHAEVFVIDNSGASTASLTIFKLADRRLAQVTAGSRPVDLKEGGSVTHMDGFRCAGSTLITTSESTGPPDYKTISYRRTTYAWDGTRLQQISQQTGTLTGTLDVRTACGDLP